MKISRKLPLGLVAVALFCAPAAMADRLAYVSILGSNTQNGTYTGTLDVTGGGTYYYEVVLSMAAIGTSNNQSGTIRTISSLTTADGGNTLSFSIPNSAAGTIPAAFAIGSFQNNWGNATSQNVGTQNGDGISAVRAGQSPGTFAGGTSPSVVYTGTFTVASTISSGLNYSISPFWPSTTNATFKINGGVTSAVASTGTETGADPFFGYNGLALFTQQDQGSAVPAPSVLGGSAMAGLVAVGGWIRRRRSILA